MHLVIVDIVSPDPLTSDELSDVVAVVVQEDGHGGEEGRPDDDPHLVDCPDSYFRPLGICICQLYFMANIKVTNMKEL